MRKIERKMENFECIISMIIRYEVPGMFSHTPQSAQVQKLVDMFFTYLGTLGASPIEIKFSIGISKPMN